MKIIYPRYFIRHYSPNNKTVAYYYMIRSHHGVAFYWYGGRWVTCFFNEDEFNDFDIRTKEKFRKIDHSEAALLF